ncbi:MAG TPA: RDD family protein [Candidatus Dormibacteraeota bacterium]
MSAHQLSPDGNYYWDGAQWQPALSPDGHYRWDGTEWVPTAAAAPAVAATPAWTPPPEPAPEAPPQIQLPPGPISPWIAANYPHVKQTAAYSTTFYAGFWIRFVAIFIDGLIYGIPTGIVLVLILVAAAGGRVPTSDQANSLSLPLDLISVVVGAAYFCYFWSTGATPGMRLFRQRVLDADTSQPIGVGRALLRYVGYLVSLGCCYVGLIWAAFDGRKQGWHDKLARTVVVYASGR